MIQFILNDQEVQTEIAPGTTLLDFIRYHQQLTGTKIGCREGDCGACTVLVGQWEQDNLVYRSATSCLMAIGNATGKHIVTVEGTNLATLNYIQQAFVDEGASQCGFCTPGFMVSLAGYVLSGQDANPASAIDAVNGNICRCTGYKSIQRATARIANKLSERGQQAIIPFAVENGFLPPYFLHIRERLLKIRVHPTDTISGLEATKKYLAGGTDLYVQQHDTMHEAAIDFLFDKSALQGVYQKGSRCYMGAAATVTDLAESVVVKSHFPRLEEHIRLVSSTPIRNMATIAGNLVNASPIGDFTIFLLALDAHLVLLEGNQFRELPLKDFYLGYKQLAKHNSELIQKIWFELPDGNTRFNFEKVCKRTHLDIASVNSAMSVRMNGNRIQAAHLSAGGVGPVPLYLKKASAFLSGKQMDTQTLDELLSIIASEISPISDARGSADYKKLLLAQLVKCHCLQLFPEIAESMIIAADKY